MTPRLTLQNVFNFASKWQGHFNAQGALRIDTGGPLGRAIIVIVSAIAELDRSLIIERVRAGLRRAKLESRQIGRRPAQVDRYLYWEVGFDEVEPHGIQNSETLSRRVYARAYQTLKVILAHRLYLGEVQKLTPEPADRRTGQGGPRI